MGIPKYYRWLSERYPLVNQPGGSTVVPIIDNLYLDMNGVIHNCTHGNSESSIKLTEKEMILKIFNYLDKLVSIAQPQKLLFMAIDGVAPRAKMNQQRSRRFKSALEAAERLNSEGPPEPGSTTPFDSNCITPGTPFMMRLGEHIRFFIRKRMEEDPLWAQLTVIFSGHEVPGEGEHKITEHIRWAKLASAYPPNTRHCMYGLDADLIMLSLVTHEPHFCLMREVVTFGGTGGKPGQPAREVLENPCREHFVFFNIGLLRDYLELDFRPSEPLPFAFDLERIIDDFVLFCMLVGNDFLPPIPTLDINEGSLDMMIGMYKKLLPQMGGYLTNAGTLHSGRLEVFLAGLAEVEAEALHARAEDTEELESRRRKKKTHKGMDDAEEEPAWVSERVDRLRRAEVDPLQRRRAIAETLVVAAAQSQFEVLRLDDDVGEAEEQSAEEEEEAVDQDRALSRASVEILEAENRREPGHELELLAEVEGGGEDEGLASPELAESEPNAGREAESSSSNGHENGAGKEGNTFSAPLAPTMMSKEARDLFLNGGDKSAALENWRQRYYTVKLGVPNDEAGRRRVVESYVLGLHWVLEYYYRGVISWNWFYPFHYAPMASDLVNLTNIPLSFTRGDPFLPYEQLLAVQPAASKALLPVAYQHLMTDTNSPIIDFYPSTFNIDLEGKRAEWEGVVLVPFIDESRLLAASRSVPLSSLSAAEQAANRHGPALVFTSVKDGSKSAAMDRLAPYCKSTLPDHFGDVSPCTTTVTVRPSFPPLPMGQHGFVPELVPGTRVKKGVTGGYPSLGSLHIGSDCRCAGVKIFGRPSNRESLILAVPKMELVPDGSLLGSMLVGRKVWIRWPYLVEGTVESVHTATGEFSATGLERDYNDAQWSQLVGPIQNEYLTKKGLDVLGTPVWVSVCPLKHLHRHLDGTVQKEFEEDAELVPMQLALRRNPNPDPRFDPELVNHKLADIDNGARGVLLSGPYRGCVASVRGVARKGEAARLVLSLSVQPPLSTEASIARSAQSILRHGQRRFVPAHVAARQLGVSPSTLGRMTGSLWLIVGESRSDRLDIGMCVRQPGPGLFVPDAARFVPAPSHKQNVSAPPQRPVTGVWVAASPVMSNGGAKSYDTAKSQAGGITDDVSITKSTTDGARSGVRRELPKGHWEYSEELLRVLRDYKAKAPWVWAAVEADGSARDLFAVRHAPGKDDEAKEASGRALHAWLRTLPMAQRPLVKLGARVAPESCVKMFQGTVLPTTGHSSWPIELQAVPAHMLAPPLQPSSTVVYEGAGGAFDPGDRVVSLRDGRSPPFGGRGTVTGVLDDGKTIEVVFDTPFVGATDLQGRCTGAVGLLCAAHDLLNVTVRGAESGAAAARNKNNNIVPAPFRKTASAGTIRKKTPGVPSNSSITVVDEMRTTRSIVAGTQEQGTEQNKNPKKKHEVQPRAPQGPSDRGFEAGRGRGKPVEKRSKTPPGSTGGVVPLSAAAQQQPTDQLQRLFDLIPKGQSTVASPNGGSLLAMLQRPSTSTSENATQSKASPADRPTASLDANTAKPSEDATLAPPPFPSSALLSGARLAAAGPPAQPKTEATAPGMDASSFWDALGRKA